MRPSRPVLLVLLLLCAASAIVWSGAQRARRSAPSVKSPSVRIYSPPRRSPPAKAGPSIARDTRGRIKRSAATRDHFRRAHPCPATGKATGACPGYVIDHIKPLACGGSDTPDNMQWQTAAAARAKDKWERAGCR